MGDNGTAARSWLIAAPILAVALVVVVVFAVGQSPTDDDTRTATAGLSTLEQDLAAHEWLLDRSDSSLTNQDDNPITLVFRGDEVFGVGPCNQYRGHVSVDDDDNTVTITDLAQTGASCDPAVMRAEDEYFSALQSVHDVEMPDGHDKRRLELRGDDGTRLAYDAIDLDDLIVGSWQIVNIARGPALQSVVVGTSPTLDFRADGDLAVQTGCNQVIAGYALDGDRLILEHFGRSFKECPEPPEAMSQEEALLRVLESGERVAVVPGQLTIVDRDDNIVIVAVRDEAGT